MSVESFVRPNIVQIHIRSRLAGSTGAAARYPRLAAR
jgi:hypothetical protein